ncbi:Uncharacterised protein [Mycobacterium tuberculosis]|nr:Uncharacterised protein [Mycobacterium tuberculosis]
MIAWTLPGTWKPNVIGPVSSCGVVNAPLDAEMVRWLPSLVPAPKTSGPVA